MITVTLQKNGRYWQAKWRQRGQQRGKSLGPAEKISSRAAKLMARRLEDRLNSGVVEPGKAPGLKDYCERFLRLRSDLSAGTAELYQQTIRYLNGFFSENVSIDRIARADAEDWRAELANGKLAYLNKRSCAPPSEPTVCRSVREAKCIFKSAVKAGLIDRNPFDHLTSTPPEPDKDWEYIDRKMLGRLLDACPSDSWRLLLALSRLAGLRQGEALRLKWSDVDLENRRLTVRNPLRYKTTKKKTRRVPIEPMLHDLLFEIYMNGERSKTVLVGMQTTNLWRDFQVIAKRAGLEPWPKWCHTLRKNCETDWAGKLKVHAYTEFFGHSPEVAMRHYTRAEDSDFAAITELDTVTASRDNPQKAKA